MVLTEPESRLNQNWDWSFDPIAAAETATDLSLTYLFNAERANRIVYQSMLDAEQLGFPEFLKTVLEHTPSSKTIVRI